MSKSRTNGTNSRILAFALMSQVCAPGAVFAAMLSVPQQYSTIQAAIDAAADGDSILVSPGTYAELVDFLGKSIIVESTSGAALTIIDGRQAGTVVRMVHGAGQTQVLRGFTIRGGYDAGGLGGGGILVYGGPALIEANLVIGNFGCPGGGIAAAFSSATIRNNVIRENRPNCTGGPGGGGLAIVGAGTVRVLQNRIEQNVSGADGGGISLFAAGAPIISGNTIVENAAGGGAGGWGGGIALGNASDALITNNIIARNRAFGGGGIYWLVPSGQSGPTVVNNTAAFNTATRGSAVLADGFDVGTQLTNNVLVGSGASAVLECGDLNDTNPPVITFNDVFHAEGQVEYGGICVDQTGVNGNISVDPLFVDALAGDFHLQAGSPAIDTGVNGGSPADDIDGDPRPADGDGDGLRHVDMGADEVIASDTTPPSISCSVMPEVLWPPNGKLQKVEVAVTASDDGGSVSVALVSVTSSDEVGDDPGSPSTDIQGWDLNTDDRSGLLRAERFKDVRTYTLSYRAQDPAGNTSNCEVKVTVPKTRAPRAADPPGQ